MTFKKYQKEAEKTWIKNYYDLERIGFGICGEAGEIGEKFKKFFRRDFNKKTFKNHIKKELGDLLYYIAKLCNWLHLDFEQILDENITKLKSRKQRNKIKGSGDNR